MAILKGNAGALKLSSNTVTELQNWSVDVGQEYVDTTSFGDTMKENTPTFASWTATSDGHVDLADTNGQAALMTAVLGGTTVTPKFYFDATHYLSGLAYVAATYGAAVDGVCNVKYTFTSAGTLAYS